MKKIYYILLVIFVYLNSNSTAFCHFINQKSNFVKDTRQLKTSKNLNDNKIKFLNYNDILFSSIIGGTASDYFISISKDKDNNLYAVGCTKSSNFPSLINGSTFSGATDIVICKFDALGNIIWTLLIGGNGNDYATASKFDKNNNLWICGESGSSNFPVSSNAFQKNNRGGTADAILLKLDTNGNILYSTYFGGSDYDSFADLTLDSNDNVWLTGRTFSKNFPTTSNAKNKQNKTYYDFPIVVFNNNCQLLYSSYFGAPTVNCLTLADAICCDKDNNIIFTGYSNDPQLPISTTVYQKVKNSGYDSFIAKFDINYNLIWCSYFGGNGNDYGSNIKIDNDNNIIIQHYTTSNDLQVINSNLQKNFGGGMDCFLTKFNSNGGLIWSSYLGGNLNEAQDYSALIKLYGGVDVDSKNNIFVYFRTESGNLPVQGDFLNMMFSGGDYDTYITKLDSNSNMIYSSYFGGKGLDYAGKVLLIDDSSFAICGATNSNDFPLVNSYQQNLKDNIYDAFLTVFTLKNIVKDTTNPATSSLSDSCHRYAIITVTDTGGNNSGLKSYNVLLSNNCSIKLIDSTDSIFKFRIDVINQSLNAYYKIKVSDEQDNIVIIDDSLLAINSDAYFEFLPKDSLDFDTCYVDSSYCKMLMIINTGTQDLNLSSSDLALKIGTDYTIPQTQFPIHIAPKDTFYLRICFTPQIKNYKIYKDSINIIFGCFNLKYPISAVLVAAKDTIKPIISSFSDSCHRYAIITVTDTGGNNSGLKSYNILLSNNCSINLIDSTDSIFKFRIDVINQSLNAYYKIKVSDNQNNVITIDDSLLAINSDAYFEFFPKNSLDFDTCYVDSTYCKMLMIINTGTQDLNLSSSDLALKIGTDYTIPQTQFPIHIAPKDTFYLQVCFTPQIKNNKTYLDSINIIFGCFNLKYPISAVLIAAKDTTNPSISRITDPCNLFTIISFSDTGSSNSGLKSYNILHSDNCSISLIQKYDSVYIFRIDVQNQSQIAHYKILVTDNQNNSTCLEDSLMAVNFNNVFGISPSDSLDFDTCYFGYSKQKQLMLINYCYQNLVLTSDDIVLYYNVAFSLPQSQFPIIIAPKDTFYLTVYFMPHPIKFRTYRDTLKINFSCGYKLFPLVGLLVPDSYFGQSQCKGDILLKEQEDTANYHQFAVDFYPNPANNEIRIMFNDSISGVINIKLLDNFGNCVSNNVLNNSVKDINLDLSKFSSGIYNIIIKYQNKIFQRNVVVIH